MGNAGFTKWPASPDAMPPDAAIGPEEGAESIVAATMMRDGFADASRDNAEPVVALFDAIVEALTGPPERAH